MADEVKAERTDVHQTMTANRLDPGIQADGSMQAGQGVGAQSQQKVHEEGVEHIKDKIDERGSGGPTDTSVGAPSTTVGSTTKGTDSTAAPAFSSQPKPIQPAKPPASNPGADDATAGMAKTAGGVSNTARIESPVPSSTPTSAKRKSIFGSFRDVLGFGAEKDKIGKSGKSNEGAYVAPVVVAPVTTTNTTSEPVTGKETTFVDRTKEQNQASGDAPGSKDRSVNTTAEPISEENKTTGTADPARDGSAPGEPTGQASSKDKGEGEGKDGKGKDLDSGADPRTRENHEAIPTAGGEKLGEKHWGESKIIPENPKKQEAEGEQAGVSSKAGQPTSEVKDNTNKNTGGATGGPAAPGSTGNTSTSGTPQEKAKFTDKIKGALKMGKKDKS